MAKRDFNTWMATFRPSIADYKYYVDFEKVYTNAESVKVELNILNSLIGSKNIHDDFCALVSRYPEVLRAIPILIAKRESEIPCRDEKGAFIYDFKPAKLQDGTYTPEYFAYFMEQVGLFQMIQGEHVHNLVDYVTGVEVGLDSNGRKNRGGHLMEDLVEGFIVEAGFEKGVTYFKEMYGSEIEERWGLDLSAISNEGKTSKRFDFVVRTPSMVYAIETNFYGSGGSKLNETARSYKNLALEAAGVEGLTFVWFTDGAGWKSARHNLEETFDVMEHIYSICDLEDGIIGRVFK